MNEIDLARFVDGVTESPLNTGARHIVYLLHPKVVTEREVDIINAELERRGVEAHVLRTKMARISLVYRPDPEDLGSPS